MMLIRYVTRPFRQLQGRLTLSYMLTSVVAFVLVELLVIGGGLIFFVTHIQSIVLSDLSQKASQAAPYLSNAMGDPEPLATWLHITAVDEANQGTLHTYPIFLAITDPQGRVIVSAGSRSLPSGVQIQTVLSAPTRGQLLAILNDPSGKTNAVGEERDGTWVVMTSVMDEYGRVQGVLALKIQQPYIQGLFAGFFQFVLFSAFMVTVLTGIIGTIFGYLIARGLTRRFKRLSAAADRWSRGDFSHPVEDRSQDELGQMARQLNHMTEQLQNLLQTRQQLAALEERNRLARDLHDSVKQQVFAVSMQIGATKLLLRRDIDAAEERVLKAEKLVQQAQQELTSLIRELRPLALDGKGLIVALRELALQWSQQSDIVANLRVEGSQTLPLTVEEALFRVAQEALSNVARHSQAALVQLSLIMTSETVTLTIHDDGQGFDPARLEQRGIGLLSMQERMKALGGDMRLESASGKGTRVVAFCTRLGTTSEAEAEEAKVGPPGTKSPVKHANG